MSEDALAKKRCLTLQEMIAHLKSFHLCLIQITKDKVWSSLMGADSFYKEFECNPPGIVGKKWDPGILDPGPFSGQIRKVEARLGKLPKIRKSEIN